MKICLTVLGVLWGSTLCIPSAQAQGTLIPTGLFTRGAGEIGTRSGKAVGLRLYAGVSAVYDNGLQPVSVDPSGKLISVDDLYGVEVALGVYGQRQYKRGTLGLDYRGAFRHYNTNTYYDGSDQQFALGYTYQKSQRVVWDFRQVAGSSASGASFVGGLPPAFNSVVDPTAMLFDNRSLFLQSGADMTYIKSPRTSFTAGGNWSMVDRQSEALIGVKTYGLHGTIQRRQSRTTMFGGTYNYTHYDFPRGYGESDIHTFQGFFHHSYGRWDFSVSAGAYYSQVLGLQTVPLDPVIAQLFGVSTIVQQVYRTNLLPNAEVTAIRSFKNAWVTMDYRRTITTGNGVYLTSREEYAGASVAYTGIRKWSFNALANFAHLDALGQGLPPYSQYSAGTGFTYSLTRALHASAHYDARHYDIQDRSFRRTASRITIGLVFSPGDIPLSFH